MLRFTSVAALLFSALFAVSHGLDGQEEALKTLRNVLQQYKDENPGLEGFSGMLENVDLKDGHHDDVVRFDVYFQPF